MGKAQQGKNHQQRIAQVFDQAAPGYDKPALRFFPLCAERLVALANLPAGARVLDVATGTGAAAIPAARAAGPAGRLVGIDLAPAMLAGARRKAEAAGLAGVDFRQMDAVALDFPDDTFDAVLCAFGVFLMPDEVGALKEWRRVLVPGGRMALSVFGAEAFQPLSNLFVERIRAFGVNLHDQPHFSTQKITTPGQCRDLLAAAGFTGIETRSEQLGYSLTSPDEWWEIVVGSGFRGTLARLDPARLDEFKAAHLADVESARTADGLWLDVPAIFASGRK